MRDSETKNSDVCSVLIFGAGYHGRAAYRALRRDHAKWKVVGFIDNDRLKQNKHIMGSMVYSPASLSNIKFDKIILSGRDIDAFRKQLLDVCGVNEDILCVMSKTETKLTQGQLLRRSRDLSIILKQLLPMFENNNIEYWLDNSGLLSLMRGQDLAELADVDISVRREDIAKVIDMIMSSSLWSITSTEFDRANGDYFHVVLTSNNDIKEYEPAIVDIGCYMFDKYPGNIVRNDIDLSKIKTRHFGGHDIVAYEDIVVRVPLFAEEYLETVYGGDWRTPAEIWLWSQRKLHCQVDS